jgi:RHS repeat-associated protein
MRVLAGRLARVAAAATGILLVTAGTATAVPAIPRPHKFVPPPVQHVKVLPRMAARLPASRAVPHRPSSGLRADAAWPSAGSGTAVLPAMAAGATGAALRAGSLPVAAPGLPLKVARAGAAGRSLSRVRATIAGHGAASSAGVTGVLITLGQAGRLAGRAPGGRVNVSLSYSSFRNAGGADFGSRLRLVELPACALTTPRVAACRAQTPLRSVNDGSHLAVTAAVDLPASGPLASLAATGTTSMITARPQVVLAAVAGASGSNGDFTATSLSPSGSWSAGGSAGDFTWSYPITVPPSAAGAAPSLSLDYSSSSVDGRTAQTNNQFGMIGEGFSLADNYIERSYTDCADDPEGAIAGKFDNCWAGNVVTMSLGGRSTQLIVDGSGNWHELQDNGDRVQYLTGTAADTNNGTYDNGYWVITTTTGTQYFFGKNRGPGWSGQPETNSAWTEPVYGPHDATTGPSGHPADPCFDPSGFAASVCSQAWRWNLDFTIDPNQNATAYYYAPEKNFYGANGATTGVQYVRGGYLSKIDYGLRDESGSIYAGASNANPPDEVLFDAVQRCFPVSQGDCDASNFTVAPQRWLDTPEDQQCLQGATCDNHAPTFWSQLRIDAITTRYWNGSSYTPVDTYAFQQSFPASGDPELELDSITRKGFSASGTELDLPPVNLGYQLMNNRIPGYNGQSQMAHWRLHEIQTETGEVITVTYNSECTAANIPADPSTNTTLCYPVYWTPFGDVNPILDYFNKYVVSSVLVDDGTVADPSRLTQYTYVGNPAWHYDDNQVVKAKNRTYGQFRGYGTVKAFTGDPATITNGAADVQTETDTTYYRGMDGDQLPTGNRSVKVTDSLGEQFTDTDALAGVPLEVRVLNGAGGAEVSDKITQQQVTTVTGTETVSGLPNLNASMTGTTRERDFTDKADGTQLVATTATTYDGQGRIVLVDQSGTAIPETCTQTSYADNAGAWIRDAVAEVIRAQQACPATPGGLSAAAVFSDVRTFYDGATSLSAPPTAGNPTQTDEATANSSGTLTWRTAASQATYDSSGRMKTSTDGRGNVTTVTYTPADGGPLTAVATGNALAQTSTVTKDPGRGVELSSTDVAGYLTTAAYDPLGRLTGVWRPGRSRSAGASANVTYSYLVDPAKPLAVTTNTLVDSGTGTSYVTSVSIYDSLGSLRQTQSAAEGTETVVTDNFYDSHGWVVDANNKYVIAGNPSATLVSEADSAVSDRTITSYDGTGRVVRQRNYNGLTQTDFTQTVYGGNQVTTIAHNAAGTDIGTPSATVTNVLGQAVQAIQYASPPTVSAAGVVTGGSPQVTTTAYDAAGNKTSITDPSGNAWTYTYDLLGEQLTQADPDAGTTTTGYDPAGNVAFTTNALSQSLNYTYDALNRKTAEFTGSTTQGSGTQDATWAWDTLKKGRLSFETSITGSVTYKTGNLGYDSAGHASGTFVIVPAGQPLAGTYRTQYTYTTTGQLTGELPAAGGGLPADSLAFTYDQFGNPVTEKGFDEYVHGATWTPFGEISQLVLGVNQSAAALTYNYDPHTRNVTGINLSDQQPAPQADDTTYTYNPAQQVTKITDTQGVAGSATETQCFSYDGLSRMTQAWSATDGCAANPSVAGNSTVNGPQPYWQTWGYDALGDITSRIDNATAGSGTTKTTAYSYGVPGHAHAVKQTDVASSGPSTYFGYDAAGNTTAVTSTSAAGPLVSGLVPTTGRLCLDDAMSSTTPGNKIDIFTCNGSTAQSWQFTGGHLQVLSNCAEPAGDGTANNTLIVLEPCSATTAAQNWTAGPNGSWINVSSGKCLDDPGSTKTPGTQLQLFTCNKSAAQSWASQQYTWTPQGKVASIAALPASGTIPQTTSYIYTADGDEITETGPAGTTLFLPGEQLTTNGTTTTGMRYYTFAGKPIAEANGTTLYWTEANLQGTLQVALSAFSESSPVTRRTVTPYGGMVPGTGTWPDNRTFLNDPSTAAGLIDIGARKYNPVTGTFLSVDPVLDPANPQSMTGYAYAAGDPVNASDPTGLCAKSMPDEQTQVDCAGKVVNPPPACTFFCGPQHDAPNLSQSGPQEHGHNAADRPYTPPPPTPGRPPVEPVEPAPTNSTPLPGNPATGIGTIFGTGAAFLFGGFALLGSIAAGGTGAAAETDAAVGVALGLQDEGDIRNFARARNLTHFLNMTRDEALGAVRSLAFDKPGTAIHVNLDGFDYIDEPARAFKTAYDRGAGTNWFTTEREMRIVGESVRRGYREWSTITFYVAGEVVGIPLPDFLAG